MTTPFPPEPTPPPQHRRDDEWIAALVALSAIAGILFWVLGKPANNSAFRGFSSLFGSGQTSTPSQSLFGSGQTSDSSQSLFGSLWGATQPSATARDSSAESSSLLKAPTGEVEPLLPQVFGRGAANRSRATQPQIAASSQASKSSKTSRLGATTAAAAGGALLPAAMSPAATESPSTAGDELRFKDVPRDYWAYKQIIELTDRGIIAGFTDRTFRPEQPITRAEFATLVRDVFSGENRSAINFKDIGGDFWAAKDINRAVEKGIMKGYPGEVFKPTQQIPRVEALVALSSGFNLQPPANPQQVLEKYNDWEKAPKWSIGSLASASEKGLVVNRPGADGQLEPQRPATRADVAAMLYEAVVKSDSGNP